MATNEKDTEINFTPLNPGLGFHPFSGGLPYAPVAKPFSSSEGTGTGAVAAGPPIAVRPHYQPHHQPHPHAHSQIRTIRERPQNTILPAATEDSNSESYSYWYLVKRMLAYLLDFTTNITLCGIAFGLVFIKNGLGLEVMRAPGILILSALFILVFNWALITAQEVAFNTSFGKRVFGLMLSGSAGATFSRALLFVISSACCGVGLFWALFKRNKRCWHDSATNLQPEYIHNH